MDSPIGSLYMQTFRKLPITDPSMNENKYGRASLSDNLFVRAHVIYFRVRYDLGPELVKRLVEVSLGDPYGFFPVPEVLPYGDDRRPLAHKLDIRARQPRGFAGDILQLRFLRNRFSPCVDLENLV